MTSSNGHVDNLVIGGGLAGAMVAQRLAAAGRSVTVLEKERSAHHKVCGEFLSREAVDYLRQVGVDPLALGAVSIRFVRLSSNRKVVESALPFTALSLSRFALDQAMLARAEEVDARLNAAFLWNNSQAVKICGSRNSVTEPRCALAPSF